MTVQSGAVVGLKYSATGLGGKLLNNLVTCDTDKYPYCYAEYSVSPGSYTVSAMVSGVRISKGNQLGNWKIALANCTTQSLEVTGEVQSRTVFIKCSEPNGDLDLYNDPCKGMCKSGMYLKQFKTGPNGNLTNNCCCASANETDDRKCDCCINDT